MQITQWREKSIRLLAEDLGPAAELLVDTAMKMAGLTSEPIRVHQYSKFLRALYVELPADLDKERLNRKALCNKVCRSLLGGVPDWFTAK